MITRPFIIGFVAVVAFLFLLMLILGFNAVEQECNKALADRITAMEQHVLASSTAGLKTTDE